MNEFNNFFAERLYTPERCQECPIAVHMRTEIETQLSDIEELTRQKLLASPRTVRRVELARSGMTDHVLQESQHAIETAFNAHGDFASKCQTHLAHITNDCVGPADLEKTLPLGNTVRVIVCGSAALETCSIAEPVHIERRDMGSSGISE